VAIQGKAHAFHDAYDPDSYQSAALDPMPGAGAVQAMMKYKGELKKAGVLLALEGLHSSG
jgi:hypothetical protein